MYNDLQSKVFYRDNQNRDVEIGPVGGGIFITNITPVDNSKVVSLNLNSNSVSQVVDSFLSDTQLINVTLEWDGVAGEFNGFPTLFSIYEDSILNTVIVSSVTQIGSTRRFTATVQIDLDTLELEGNLLATYQGRNHHIGFELLPEGPQIESVQWFSLPLGQSELKNGDTIDGQFVFNSNDVSQLIFESYGFSGGATYNVSVVQDTPSVGKSTVVVSGIPVINGNNTLQNLGFRIKAKNAFGTVGNLFEVLNGSNTYSGTGGLNSTLPLNNLHPSFSFVSLVYPVGQGALKNSETADITVNLVDGGASPSLLYTSPNNELSIDSPLNYSATKTVTRIDGSYNITNTNYLITATRSENGASTNYTRVIFIAHVAPVINISVPFARLRSGGNNGTSIQNYTVTMTSSQRLYQPPQLDAPEGNLSSFSYVSTATTFTATIGIHDNDVKGNYNFFNLFVKNLANIDSTVINSGAAYVIGGFVKRTINFAPFKRQSAIGTAVGLIAKLQATNLSKGASNSLNTTYKSVTGTITIGADEVDKYTISDGGDNAGVEVGYAIADINGTHIYNLDGANANSNSTGDLQFEIEEVV